MNAKNNKNGNNYTNAIIIYVSNGRNLFRGYFFPRRISLFFIRISLTYFSSYKTYVHVYKFYRVCISFFMIALIKYMTSATLNGLIIIKAMYNTHKNAIFFSRAYIAPQIIQF